MKKSIRDEEWINKARIMQQQCKEIHVIAPPVVLWKAEIFNKHGKQIEEIIGKSNSYNRNGLNLLFANLCAPSSLSFGTLFQDGVISWRNKSGAANGAAANFAYYISDSYQYIEAGYSTASESIDHHNLQSTFGTGNSVNQLNRGITQLNTSFDNVTRKFYNDVVRSFGNGYGSAQDITELGLFVELGRTRSTSSASLSDVMIMRDLLDPAVTVPAGGAVNMHYNFEIQY